jgi:hypothetical protein
MGSDAGRADPRRPDDRGRGFEVDAELKAVLLESIAECDRGETITADELLRELQSDE